MATLRTAFSILTLQVIAFAAPAAHVFTMTNAPTGNSILVFNRSASGALTLGQTVPTGGLGLGGSLGSQGALLNVTHYLLAVNGGSNTITVLNIGPTKLTVASAIASGGMVPISLTYAAGYVYVLNAGSGTAAGNISGFSFNSTNGRLTPLAGSTQLLSAASVGPAQVSFNRTGTALIVTEKDTSLIDMYAVGANGVAGPPTSYASHGVTPFGFETGAHNRFYVSEAFRGLGPVSAVSSYMLSTTDVPTVISGSVPTGELAACWLVLSPNGEFAYVTDTPSNLISVFSITSSGALTLLPAFNMPTGLAGPLDEAITSDGVSLYALNSANGTIAEFTVNANGSLTPLGTAVGVTGANPAGLVAH
jgi:DNA-binding beta-propeller fold protein YncE